MKEYAERVEKAVVKIRGSEGCYDGIPKDKQTNIKEVCEEFNVPVAFVKKVLGYGDKRCVSDG